jgi:predicted small secreted protein
VHDPVMIKPLLCILVVAAAAFATACGTERTDVSAGVDQLNSQVLSAQGLEADCPDEVEGGAGTEFECTLKATSGGGEQKVKLKIVEEEGELAVDRADPAAFDKAVSELAAK